MILNSKFSSSKKSIQNPTLSPNSTSMPRIAHNKNLSESFINVLKRNYLTVKQRAINLGDKNKLDPIIEHKYENLFDTFNETYTSRISQKVNRSASHKEIQISLAGSLENYNHDNLVKSNTKRKIQNNKFNISTSKAVMMRKAVGNAQSLYFLANQTRDINQEESSHARLLATNRSPLKNNRKKENNPSFIVKKPMILPNVNLTSINDKNLSRPFDINPRHNIKNFCDYNIPTSNNGTSLLPFFNNKNHPVLNKANYNINIERSQSELKDNYDEKGMGVYKNISSIKILGNNPIKRREKLNNKDRNFIQDHITKKVEKKKLSISSHNRLQVAIDRLDKHNQGLAKTKLHIASSKKINVARRLSKIFQNRIDEELNEAISKDLINAKKRRTKTVWMEIIENLLSTECILKDTKVGYYQHFRLINDAYVPNDSCLLIHINNKLKTDLINEKKFNFNFRIGND